MINAWKRKHNLKCLKSSLKTFYNSVKHTCAILASNQCLGSLKLKLNVAALTSKASEKFLKENPNRLISHITSWANAEVFKIVDIPSLAGFLGWFDTSFITIMAKCSIKSWSFRTYGNTRLSLKADKDWPAHGKHWISSSGSRS